MSKSDIALHVENLGKMYRLGKEIPPAKTLGGKVLRTVTSPFDWLGAQMREPTEDEILWALKDVSFEINRGEVVGFIGHNGAGKSTLLKILSRITEPSTGYAEIHGRIAALLEVGTGMSPELTGRENIYMNGTVLGMKKKEIDRKLDEIIDFSGIERFLDTPVKRYSSGMRVRLGFAIAAHLEPEILIVDEVLAVGDADFQGRCLNRMSEVAKSGRTILFVSHNMGAIQTLCERAFVLRNGAIIQEGNPQICIQDYYAVSKDTQNGNLRDADRQGTGVIQLAQVELINSGGHRIDVIHGGEEVSFHFHLSAKDETSWNSVRFGFNITSYAGTLLAYLDSDFHDFVPECGNSDKYVFKCKIPRFPLVEGRYAVTTFLRCQNEMADKITNAFSLTVEKGSFYHSGKQAKRAPFMIDCEWA